jgi:hypothetical protein
MNIIDPLHREFHKDSKKSSFTILRLSYNLLCIFEVHPFKCNNNSEKEKAKYFYKVDTKLSSN